MSTDVHIWCALFNNDLIKIIIDYIIVNALTVNRCRDAISLLLCPFYAQCKPRHKKVEYGFVK